MPGGKGLELLPGEGEGLERELARPGEEAGLEPDEMSRCD